MCLLFYHVNENPGPNEYQLILVNVRDEYYSRKTQICRNWNGKDDDKRIIAAKDLHKGREGGTWLGLNKNNGKIGILLNILQPDTELSGKIGRGFLVTDYLSSDHHSPITYLQEIERQAKLYNGFVMLAMQCAGDGVNAAYYSNFYNESPDFLKHGTHAFGNSLYHRSPWPKVSYGKKLFEDIVKKHPTSNTKRELLKDIFAMLNDRTRFPVDEQLLMQGRNKPLDVLECFTSILVEIPKIKYGSRTWSVILINADGYVDYIERTMEEPIYCDDVAVHPNWLLTSNSFLLTQTSEDDTREGMSNKFEAVMSSQMFTE